MVSGCGRVCAAWRAAVSSIRWLVVSGVCPLFCCPSGVIHAHPPGPGFPMQDPSVYTVVGVGGVFMGW